MMEGAAEGQVRYTQGSPQRLSALMKAGLCEARCVLILAREEAGGEDKTDLADTDALLTHNLVRRNAPGVYVTTELLESDSVKFIHHEPDGLAQMDGRDLKYFLPYATGQIFSSLLFNLFMSKIQRRISAYAVFEQLIYGVTTAGGGGLEGEEAWPVAACPYQPRKGAGVTRNFRMEPVPPSLVGATFGEAHAFMVRRKGLVPVGLLAMRGFPEPVVLTMPRAGTVIGAQDLIYVIEKTQKAPAASE